MSSKTHVITVKNVSKEYKLGQSTGRAALSDLSLRYRPRSNRAKPFKALDDVSFDVTAGTALGVVGRNGAGKSTLLKVLSRITRPTSGEINIRGRVGSLLEVGTGFHPELSGRENIFMNGAILGMRRAEITRKFEDIVHFAEVARFIDTPVKRYSSGMYVRLAFAVAAHLEPEILLVDEVLAVGDVAFQKKCLGKMGEVAGEGRTVLFVSHNTAAIQQLTTECVLMSGGRAIAHGPTQDVLGTYLTEATDGRTTQDLSQLKRYDPRLGRDARFQWARLVEDHVGLFRAEQNLTFAVGIRVNTELPAARISVALYKFDGTPIGSAFGTALDIPGLGDISYDVTVPGTRLAPGRYSIGFGFGKGDLVHGFIDYDTVLEAIQFEVLPPEVDGVAASTWHSGWGSVRLPTPVVQPRITDVVSR